MCTTCAFTTATSSQVAVVRDATSAANPSKAASSSAHSLSEQPINANFLFLFLRLLVVLVKQDPKMLRSVYLCKNFPRRLWNSEKKQDSKAHFGNFSDFLVAEWKRGINQLRGDGRNNGANHVRGEVAIKASGVWCTLAIVVAIWLASRSGSYIDGHRGYYLAFDKGMTKLLLPNISDWL